MPERDRKGRLRKGAGSLNPGGRPKAVAALIDRARKLAPKALDALEKCLAAEEAPWALQVEAAKLVLAYAIGRPPVLEPEVGEGAGDGLNISIAINGVSKPPKE